MWYDDQLRRGALQGPRQKKNRRARVSDPFVLPDGEVVDPLTVVGCWLPRYRPIGRAENYGHRGRTKIASSNTTRVGNARNYLGAYDRDYSGEMFDDTPPGKAYVRVTNHGHGARQQHVAPASKCAACEFCDVVVEYDIDRVTSRLVAFDRRTGRRHVCDPKSVEQMRVEWGARLLNAFTSYMDMRKEVARLASNPMNPDTFYRMHQVRKKSARDAYFECRAAIERIARYKAAR